MKAAQADTQLLPANMSKVADKWQAVIAHYMQPTFQGQTSFN
jgi:hypothetical protein